jgi:hypothetical protein
MLKLPALVAAVITFVRGLFANLCPQCRLKIGANLECETCAKFNYEEQTFIF